MDSDSRHGRDRISNLPDAVLCHILSFLPTKLAVGTSILSRRWKYIWTSIHNLYFEHSLSVSASQSGRLAALGIKDTQMARAMSFANFVNRVLLFNDVSHIQKFHLRCSQYCNVFVHTWICIAIKRNVQELHLNLRMKLPGNLPHMLFTCDTLVSLKLSSAIVLDVPASVWLPSLKDLYLWCVKYINDDTTQKLFHACPVLEELVIQRMWQDGLCGFNISSPTLKRLCYSHTWTHDVESETCVYKLLVNAPNLECLTLDDWMSHDYLMNLSSLVRAYIDIGSRYCDDGIYKLLSGISNVKFLSLCNRTLNTLNGIDDFKLPTFYNVTRLELAVIGISSWKLLTDILESSPNLEVLILQETSSAELNKYWTPRWTPPRCVPNCLLLHLKEIEIGNFFGKKCEVEAIEYMLKNAKVLKKMAINCQHLDLDKESCVCKKLSGLPRGSRSCRLNLVF